MQIKLRQSHSCNSFGKQNGLVDRLCHLTAQTFASDVVGAEMLPGVNSAQSRLLGRRWKASEVPCYSSQGLGRNIKSELLPEVEPQHLGPGSTDGTVGTRVRRVWSRFCR
jgi:hypothetical protein